MGAFDALSVDHIRIYTADLAEAAARYAGYGLAELSRAAEPGARSVMLGRGGVRLLLTEPGSADHPGTAYLDRHGEGVADIALAVADPGAAYREAVARGATPVRPGTIEGFGDVAHTFTRRAPTPQPGEPGDLELVDHFAVCVPAGGMRPAIERYGRTLGFDLVFTERITVGGQAIETKAIQNHGVTFTLIEPDTSREPGQIDAFLERHGGPGVQHVAFTTADIVNAVLRCRERGVEFLETPAEYYRLLHDRLDVGRHPLTDLRRLSILADADHDGQLFQIFTRTAHPRETLFFELIERLGARTFGGGNIRALYEAVELHRAGTVTAAA
ncbi:VOC family protein [Actinocorallia sp. A-T 12471]|uniref:VOC family protein n=1 Tax=Actinocorallia sp. A-T 12471 TaxID=3089813 RepID=UPI0029CAD2E1|nr:VOC family protein [Actinocorallia sp. A-T 12471]MDX6741623.1 VOC family protein [Actinocorallia sp. A-T 12471]